MLELLKPFWMPIAKYGAIAISLFLAWLQVRKSGEEAIKQKNIQDTLTGVQTRDAIQDNVINTSDSQLTKLHEKYTRN